MATLSLKTVAKDVLGKTGPLSVNDDVFGYIWRNGGVFGAVTSGDTMPITKLPTARSVKSHLKSLSGRVLDLVIILVGYDVDSTVSAISPDDLTKIQYAIQVTRELYAQAPLGIRHLNWQKISPADADGYEDISDKDEATDLTDDWSGPDGGIDVFFVRSIGDAAGWSKVGGSCDKDEKGERTGAVVSLQAMWSRRFTGIVLGHEIGHYLGLSHTNSIANMMGSDVDNDGIGETDDNSILISAAEGATMRSHCAVVDGI
jgi:hypothetical protein